MTQPPPPVLGPLTGLSLRVKLTLGYALVFALTVLLGAVGVYFTARASLTHSLDLTLEETANVARASIERQGSRVFFAPDLVAAEDLSIELLSASGLTQARVGKDEHIRVLPLGLGFATAADRRSLTLAVDGGLRLRVSRSSDILSQLLETLAQILAVGSLVMIAVACAAGYALADRALRPVDAVARTAEAIARRGRYQERVPQAPGHDEMARLTRTVNTMLDGLEGTIEREKSFARTAAHELRTPLTVLKGRLELTLERPREAEADQRALLSLQGRVETLITLSESLLALARTDAPLVLEPVELASSALEAAERLSETALTWGKRLDLDLAECWVQAEAEGLDRALVNLIENALKYGGGEVVRVTVAAHACGVRSGGPGPDAQHWPRLLQPFERGAGVQAVSGSGLGLPLVVALARRWQAAVEPRWPAGEFEVRLQFPPGTAGATREELADDPIVTPSGAAGH